MKNNIKEKLQVYILLFKQEDNNLLIYATPDKKVILFESKIDLATAFSELMDVIRENIDRKYNAEKAKEYKLDIDLAFSTIDAYASLIEIESKEDIEAYVGNELVEYEHGKLALPALVILDDKFITDKEGHLLGSILADRFIDEMREKLN